MAEERLQKYMAECGIASRRKSEELIREGKVRVNGEVAEIGRKIDPKKDVVSVEGRKVQKDQKHVYLMLNKPWGFISTMSDEYDRRCVAELVADVAPGSIRSEDWTATPKVSFSSRMTENLPTVSCTRPSTYRRLIVLQFARRSPTI